MPVLGVWIAPLAPAAAHVDPKWHLDTTIVVCAQKSATSVELSWVDCDKREVTRRSTVESVPGRINGCPLCRVGDVDGDGVDDLALMGLDHVFVYSTVTGKQVLDIPLPTLSGYRAPTSACKGADIDGDGIADILIGRPDPSDCLVDGSVAAYSGKTGKHLLECNEASRGWGFGASLLSRDSSGDASVLVGKFAFIDGGVDVLSGRTLKRTAWIPGPGNESDPVIGARLFSSADFDGDGVPDVLVSRFDFESAGDPVQGVLIYSGKNYSLLGRIELGKTLASDR
jgi:hypothetical protein